MPLLDLNIEKSLDTNNKLIFSIHHSGRFSFIVKDRNNRELIDKLLNKTNIDFTHLVSSLKEKGAGARVVWSTAAVFDECFS